MSSFNPVGPQGQPGPQGPAGQVSVSQTVTGEPGTSANVENVGTTTNANLVFTIPRGDVGDTGPIGPIGPKGEPGDLADRAATITPGSAVALTITGGDIELQIPSWINSISVSEQSATSSASPSPDTLSVQDASISWLDIGGFNSSEAIGVTGYVGLKLANTTPLYSQISWFSESFTANYYGVEVVNAGSVMAPSYIGYARGSILTPKAITVSETKMTGTVRIGGNFSLMWGNVTVASTPPSSKDSNMSGGNVAVSGGGFNLQDTPVAATHAQAGIYRTYSATRTISIPALSVPVGLPDGTYTGTVSGYAFAQMPQYLVWVNSATWQSYKQFTTTFWAQKSGVAGCPSDLIGPIITTTTPWSASGQFTVSQGSVQIPARTINIVQSCPCYARIGPYLTYAGTSPSWSTPPGVADVWNALASGSKPAIAILASVSSTTVPLKKGYFVSSISLSS